MKYQNRIFYFSSKLGDAGEYEIPIKFIEARSKSLNTTLTLKVEILEVI